MTPEKENPPTNEDFGLIRLDGSIPVDTSVDENIFSSWFRSFVALQNRREYKVPSKILSLPCGCRRQRTNEGDVNNSWHIKRKHGVFSHKECNRVLRNM